jgi:glyoxylase-like metal-dependent hydrolase (beta-lactamase superfamily II)/rhodanese-related sulfurtransferase
MHVERFFVSGLAHASYVVTSNSEAIVIDPERRVDGYLDYLAQNKLSLKGIFLTHPHADFVAGHAELAARTGAPIFISEKAPATFPHHDLKEGDRFHVGSLEIAVLATPGHSPDSVCLCVSEGGRPIAVFTGDTLFSGDVGRPDLRDRELPATDLATLLYDSLFNKLLKLPADVKVYPAHGAGSLCGRQISSAPFTTIGAEMATNWALQFNDQQQFVDAMINNLPDRPPYFSRSVTINLQGAPSFSELAEVKRLEISEFDALRQEGATVLDLRAPALFGDAHVAGSLNIGIASPSFAVWCGFFVSPDLPVLLVADYESEVKRARLELSRIGFDQILGFVPADDLGETLQITQIGARDFVERLESGQRPMVLDVRSVPEWTQDHVEGAVNIPLPRLSQRSGSFAHNAPLVILCGSGYRSSIAASLLEAEGFERLSNVMGGMHAVRHATRPQLVSLERAETALTWEI